MSERSWTPGPWKVHGGPGRLRHHLAVIDSIPDVDGKVVANCICHVATTNEDSDANARLIATAPEMFEVLERVIDPNDHKFNEVEKRIQEIIKRVRGDDGR